ncbi:hypothetical protein DL95DRAFT_468542 [Leptodontidium sp. 2 PMI_412]|nr:hypothetical protein DL95DRAFT_468542 [Leptodontidium sp. 2 PMI_412]
MPREGKETWENMHVTRAGGKLGTLHELRLALQFSMNEADFAAQLTFSGFYMLNSGTLFLKVVENAVQGLNQDLLIDIGDELNEKLASLAEDGYSIVLVDSRGSHADGIPIPDDDNCLRRVLRKGPAAFPTDYTKRVAGFSGWTNGRAHMASHLSAEMMKEKSKFSLPSNTFTVTQECQARLFPQHGDDRPHSTLPLTPDSITSSTLHPNNAASEGGSWIDCGLSGTSRGHNEDVFVDDNFDLAMTMPCTRAVPSRRKPKKFVDDRKYEGAPWAGYETLGRIVQDKNGRSATLEARFEGYEDNWSALDESQYIWSLG